MKFRTHVGRPFDLRLWSNRILFLLVAVSAVPAVVLWAEGAPTSVLWTPAHVFVFWALAREIDPDRTLTAHLAGAGAGAWALAQQPTPELLSVGALVLAARVLLNSTVRRPLISDLVVLGVFATAISYTKVGWVGAVALAIAIYVDGRLAEGANTASIVTSAAATLGATLVATAAGAFSVAVVKIEPVLVTAAGLTAILTILRSPPEPWSLVDSRLKWRLDQGRLHGARSLTAVMTFAITILYGADAERAVPLIGLLLVALASAEVERLRRTV